MNHTPKKIFFLTLVFLGSLGLVGASLAMSQSGNDKLVFEAGETSLLQVKPQRTEGGGFSEWEKDLLSRQTATISRNYTDDTAKQLLSEYVKARENNTKINEDVLIASILSNNSPEKIQEEIKFTEYKISDLKISDKNDKASLKKYGNSLGEISANNATDPDKGNPLDVIVRAADSNNKDELGKLNPIIASYRNMVSDLLKLEVPSELAKEHLAIINSFSKISAITEKLRNFLDDPVRGIFMLSNFARAGFDVQESFKELHEYFQSKNVTFKESDYGFLIERTANLKIEDVR